MQSTGEKTRARLSMCTNRRLDIEQQIDVHLRQQVCRTNLHYYRYREQIFQQKVERMKRNFQQMHSYTGDDKEMKKIDDDQLLKPNCSKRIQNHIKLMNFSSETERNLLRQTSNSKGTDDELSDSLPSVNLRKGSAKRENTSRCPSASKPRSARARSCRSAYNPRIFLPIDDEQNNSHPYFDEQILDEHRKRETHDQRKTFLLKEFDELRHDIDDPHATMSVITALSRTLLFLEL